MTSYDFVINGGRKLKGKVRTNTSKNGALGIMCAALLNKGSTTIKNVPRIEEVERIKEVLISVGVDCRWLNEDDLFIKPPSVWKMDNMLVESASKTRSILMCIGPLIHHLKEFSIPHDQGCKLGTRTASAHIFGLQSFGVNIKVESNKYSITNNILTPSDIVMYESSDTATESVLIAAAGIDGKSVIRYASSNYMVQDVCHYLQLLGVNIEGVGTTTIVINGKMNIEVDVTVTVGEDPIESMMWITTAIVTKSELTVTHVPIRFMELELLKLKMMGQSYTQSSIYLSDNGWLELVDITIAPSSLKCLPDKIESRPYPGLNIDNLPFFVPICAIAEGDTLIHDWVYENRAIYYMDLSRLGADMILMDPHRLLIRGAAKRWKNAEMVCPPALRPSVLLLIAMLAAEGQSILRNIYSISRGYEDIANRLNMLGADITILKRD
jgi:UDP-N-acetylglucosamine 1-carboxyvinyltransferase